MSPECPFHIIFRECSVRTSPEINNILEYRYRIDHVRPNSHYTVGAPRGVEMNCIVSWTCDNILNCINTIIENDKE